MNILFVTSFNKEIYDITGKKLLKSYLNFMNEYKLLVCYENFNIEINNNNIIYYDLSKDTFLLNWLENNKKYIPKKFGGEANIKSFANNWNIRASKWFRKIASLNYANVTFGDKYDYIIWVDADCIFKNKIPDIIFNKIFLNVGMFYYFGPYRKKNDKGYETGFLGFSKKDNGFILINNISNIYVNQKYLKFKRWDDGFIIRKMNEKYNKNIPTRDLAQNDKIKNNDVINHPNILQEYITHNKGIHTKTIYKNVFVK